MHLHRILATCLALLATSLLVLGCGAEEEAGERLAEKLIEESGGEDVDIDVDGDEVKIESKDGDASFSTSGELPDGWPEELELPDGATITGSTSIGAGEEQNLNVTADVDMDPAEVLEHFEGVLEDGWEQRTKSETTSGDGSLVIAAWAKDGRTFSITVTDGTDGDSSSLIATVGLDPNG